MPAKPFFRKSTGTYYLQLGKRQINLGADKDGAWKRYYEIMALDTPPAPDSPICLLLDQFLDWTKRHRAGRTYDWYLQFLQSFKDFYPSLTLREFRKNHVTKWLDSEVSEGSRRDGIRALQRAFNWAVDEELIEASPIAKFAKPPAGSREVYLQPEQWAEFIALTKGGFRDICWFMRWTGCRPQEARAIEAKHFQDGCIVFPVIESKGKKRQRVIPLPKLALNMIKRLSEKNTTGKLFRNADGAAWTSSALNCAFNRIETKLNKQLAKKLKRKPEAHERWSVFAYVLRHTYATDALLAGMDPIKLSECLGHSDLKMIMRTYQHLKLKRKELRDEMDRVIAPGSVSLDVLLNQPSASGAASV